MSVRIIIIITSESRPSSFSPRPVGQSPIALWRDTMLRETRTSRSFPSDARFTIVVTVNALRGSDRVATHLAQRTKHAKMLHEAHKKCPGVIVALRSAYDYFRVTIRCDRDAIHRCFCCCCWCCCWTIAPQKSLTFNVPLTCGQ